LREMAGARVTAHGHADPLRRREQVRQDPRIVMHVVVRIEVSGGAAHEIPKPRELALDFSGNTLAVAGIELEMESDAQRAARTSEGGCLLARWSIHHEARAREDALAMRPDDAAIDSARDAEIVGGDDEPSHGSLIPRSGGRSAAK